MKEKQNKDFSLGNLKAVLDSSKLNTFELLRMHVAARGGKIVDDASATTKFTFDEIARDYTKLQPFMAI